MNETTRMISVLVIICILSAVALSITYEKTNPIIEDIRLSNLKSALNEVYPSENYIEANVPKELLEKNVKQMFKAKDGLILMIEQPGFQSNIKVLVGINTLEKQITNIKILEHLETPGLGSRIEEPEFLSQFTLQPLEQQKIDAITGATISSKAVIDAVKITSQEILNSISKEEINKKEININKTKNQ